MSETIAQLDQSRHNDRLLEVSRVLSSTLELRPLLQSIIDVACELTDSEAASILLYDEAAQELRFEAAPGDQHERLKDLSVPLDTSAAGWIYQNAMPLVIHNAEQDKRVYRKVDEELGFRTSSLLGVPLLVEKQPIGVIEAVNKRSGARFSEDDLAVLETLAAQAGIAIANARLLGKLKDANAELMRLDNMKSDFIAIASHELRTPLGLILGHATFLKDFVPDDYKEQVEVIVRSALRLKDIIEDMSTIAHQEQGKAKVRMRQFSMADLVIEVVERFGPDAERKGLNLSFDIPRGQDLVVEGDRDKLDLALTNLVRNAVNFTEQGGQVGVKAEESGEYVQVFVVDTGIGIPEDEVERVFERFYQVESHLTRKHGGMGLGLSIAKAMVEMHEGQIWCESRQDVGSLFSFMLPASQEQGDAPSKVFNTA